MLIPVVVHKDEDSDYGVTIPDAPGCFTAGSTMEEAVNNVQEAIECYLSERESIYPSPLEKLMADPDYEGGTWVMVDVDLSFLRPKYKRYNITVPEHVMKQIDLKVKELGVNRSAFLVDAARRALK